MQHSDLEQKNFKNFSQTPIFFRIFIIFFFIIWTLFSLFFIHNATQHHKMTCSYKSNFCEIQIFDIKEFKYQTTHQIPLSEIKYMYLKKFEHSDDSRESYKLILKTKTREIELENMSSNFWVSSRRDETRKMKAFLNHNFSKNFVYRYQEGFSGLVASSIFFLLGIGVLFLLFRNTSKKNNQKNFAVIK